MKIARCAIIIFFWINALLAAQPTWSLDSFSVSPPGIYVPALRPGDTETIILNFTYPEADGSKFVKIQPMAETNGILFNIGQVDNLSYNSGEFRLSIPIDITALKNAVPGTHSARIIATLANNNPAAGHGVNIGAALSHEILVRIEVTDKKTRPTSVNSVEIFEAAAHYRANGDFLNSQFAVTISLNSKNNFLRKIEMLLYDQGQAELIATLHGKRFEYSNNAANKIAKARLSGAVPAGNYLAVVKLYDYAQNKPVRTERLMVSVLKKIGTEPALPSKFSLMPTAAAGVAMVAIIMAIIGLKKTKIKTTE